MRSNDWQPMETAPLNPYGKPWGPVVLIWCSGDQTPWPAYYEPWHGWKHRDCGPAWVLADGEGSPIAPEDAVAWMPIAAPWNEAPTPRAIIGQDAERREENGRFSGGSAMPDPVTVARIQNMADPWYWDGPALRTALEETRDLVMGANFAAARYPTAWAYFTRGGITHKATENNEISTMSGEKEIR